MKRILILSCVVGVVGWMCAGCERKPASPPPKKQDRTNRVARATAAKQEKSTKAIAPGTIGYLDLKNGFRGLAFGEWETNVADLVVKSQDESRHLKTCVRSDDVLSLHGVPVENIEYQFFKGQFYAVRIQWKVEHPDSALSQPPTSYMSVYCAREYGAPRTRRSRKDSVEFVWRGQKAEMVISETLMAGVADQVKGGWALPPTTSGHMLIRSILLSRVAEADRGSRNPQTGDGL